VISGDPRSLRSTQNFKYFWLELSREVEDLAPGDVGGHPSALECLERLDVGRHAAAVSGLAEKIILDTVRERLASPEHIEYALRRVEAQVRTLYANIPQSIRLKETELAAEERRLANFVDFIGEGRGSRTLAQALLETERKVEALREDLERLRRSREKVFQVPPREWIQERLTKPQQILENPDRSGPLLRNLLGPIHLEPTRGDIGRPYYKSDDIAQYPGYLGPAG
jgi:hypothetical protein